MVALTAVTAGVCGNPVDTSGYDRRGSVALGMNGTGEIIAHVEAMPDGSTSLRIESIGRESASRMELEALAPGEVIVSEWNPDAGPTESPLRNLRIRLEDFHPECPAE